MNTPNFLNSFRARLLLLLSVLLGLTLGVQYYVNRRSVESNAHLIVEQEQAIMAGVALGVNSMSSKQYLDQMRSNVRGSLLDEQSGRVLWTQSTELRFRQRQRRRRPQPRPLRTGELDESRDLDPGTRIGHGYILAVLRSAARHSEPEHQ